MRLLEALNKLLENPTGAGASDEDLLDPEMDDYVDPDFEFPKGQRIYKTVDYSDIDYANYPGIESSDARAFFKNGIYEMSWDDISTALTIPGLDTGHKGIYFQRGGTQLVLHIGYNIEFRYDLKSGIAYFDSVFLSDEDQGFGLIREIVIRQVPFVQTFKIHTIKVLAAMVGSYVWATYGFKASNATVRKWYNNFLKVFPLLKLKKAPTSMAQIASIHCDLNIFNKGIDNISKKIEELYNSDPRYPYSRRRDIGIAKELQKLLDKINEIILAKKNFYFADNKVMVGKMFLVENPEGWRGVLNLKDPKVQQHVMAMIQKKEAAMSDMPDQAHDKLFLQVMGSDAIVAEVKSVDELLNTTSTPQRLAASKEQK